MSDVGIEPLAGHHVADEFDCGEAHLNVWLKQHAWRNEGKYSRTFVMTIDGRIVGYSCLSAGAVTRAELSSAMRRNAPDVVPVTVLGRLAVDLTHQGKGVGGMLLRDALSRSLRASQTVGSRAVLIHVKNDRLREYYARFGFRSLPQHALTMVLPMERIAAGLLAED